MFREWKCKQYFMVTFFSFHELLIFFSQLGCALTQVVSCQPLIVEVWFLLLVSPCEDLWWTKWHWDRFFSKNFSFPLSLSFHQSFFTYSYISY